MEYIPTTSGERVRLDVLANADKSMVGLQIGNSKIISMQYADFWTLVVSVLGEREINNLEATLFKYHVTPVHKKNGEYDDSIIVMETVGDCLPTETILNMLDKALKTILNLRLIKQFSKMNLKKKFSLKLKI